MVSVAMKKEYMPYALSEVKTNALRARGLRLNEHEQNVLRASGHGARRACRMGALPLNYAAGTLHKEAASGLQ